MKKLLGINKAPPGHWVGDGFPVRSLFSYHSQIEQLSPFLLLDHAGPRHFEPAAQPRGVGTHPHRGFETVTIVYEGEVSHRDSTGAGGKIGPGDVQWMTAAAGILHEEFHSPEFTATGGTMEMAQLWVNLPAKDKAVAPAYQTIKNEDIPAVSLPGSAGTLRVIAGQYGEARGPARTFTPMNVWDLRLVNGADIELEVGDGHNLALVMLAGSAVVNGNETLTDDQVAVFARDGSRFTVTADADSKLLVLSGEPIDEPVVGYGPFVMNSEAEIREAINDFNRGRFGQIAANS